MIKYLLDTFKIATFLVSTPVSSTQCTHMYWHVPFHGCQVSAPCMLIHMLFHGFLICARNCVIAILILIL